MTAKNSKRRKRRTSAKDILQAKKRDEALAYRLQGYTYAEIGEAMHCSRPHALRLVEAAMAAIPAENVEQLRVMEAQRLDRLQAAHFASAIEGDFNATTIVLRIMERRARLLGLDAPQRSEVTGKNGGPIEHEAPISAEAARATLAEALAKAGLVTPDRTIN